MHYRSVHQKLSHVSSVQFSSVTWRSSRLYIRRIYALSKHGVPAVTKRSRKERRRRREMYMYVRAEKVDVDKDVFAVVEMQLSGFEHDLAHSVSGRTQHHDYTRTGIRVTVASFQTKSPAVAGITRRRWHFLLAISSNLGRSSHRFRDTASFPLKNGHFPTSPFNNEFENLPHAVDR